LFVPLVSPFGSPFCSFLPSFLSFPGLTTCLGAGPCSALRCRRGPSACAACSSSASEPRAARHKRTVSQGEAFSFLSPPHLFLHAPEAVERGCFDLLVCVLAKGDPVVAQVLGRRPAQLWKEACAWGGRCASQCISFSLFPSFLPSEPQTLGDDMTVRQRDALRRKGLDDAGLGHGRQYCTVFSTKKKKARQRSVDGDRCATTSVLV
jgi:hypothetical protein